MSNQHTPVTAATETAIAGYQSFIQTTMRADRMIGGYAYQVKSGSEVIAVALADGQHFILHEVHSAMMGRHRNQVRRAWDGRDVRTVSAREMSAVTWSGVQRGDRPLPQGLEAYEHRQQAAPQEPGRIRFTIEVEGVDTMEVTDALEEAARRIAAGNTSGQARDIDGAFSFTSVDSRTPRTAWDG